MGKPLKWTTEQKLPLVLSVLRGEGSVAEIGRRHRVSDVTLAKWRGAVFAGGAAAPGHRRPRRGAGARRLRRPLGRWGAPHARAPLPGRGSPALLVVGGGAPGGGGPPPPPPPRGREPPARRARAGCFPRAAAPPLPRLAVRLQ